MAGSGPEFGVACGAAVSIELRRPARDAAPARGVDHASLRALGAGSDIGLCKQCGDIDISQTGFSFGPASHRVLGPQPDFESV